MTTVGDEWFYYPEDFVKRVKEVFLTDQVLHQALDRNDQIIGRYLSDALHSFSARDVIAAFEQECEAKLLEQANAPP